MFKSVVRYFIRKKLEPGIVSLITNPYYFVKKGIFRGLKNNSGYISGSMLDFGCGNKSYKYLFNVSDHIGLDIYHKGHDHSDERIDVFYGGGKIPFKENSFDSVLCIEVCEHLFDIEKSLSEIWRVMKNGACLLITTPFVWEEHEQPFDFGRYTEFGLKDLLSRNRFEIVNYKKEGNFVEVIAQMWNLFIFKKLFRRFQFLRFMIIPILIFPINLIGVLFSGILPGNQDLYLHSVVVAKKVVALK